MGRGRNRRRKAQRKDHLAPIAKGVQHSKKQRMGYKIPQGDTGFGKKKKRGPSGPGGHVVPSHVRNTWGVVTSTEPSEPPPPATGTPKYRQASFTTEADKAKFAFPRRAAVSSPAPASPISSPAKPDNYVKGEVIDPSTNVNTKGGWADHNNGMIPEDERKAAWMIMEMFKSQGVSFLQAHNVVTKLIGRAQHGSVMAQAWCNKHLRRERYNVADYDVLLERANKGQLKGGLEALKES